MHEKRVIFCAAIAALAAGCRAAPPPENFDIPDDPLGGQSSAYGSFDRHIEILSPQLEAIQEQAQTYVDEGRTDCYRLPNLSACDVSGFCTEADPSAVISLTHAAVIDQPTTVVRDAIMSDEITEVYPSTFLAYAIDDAGDRESFLAGEQQLATWSATARIGVLVAEVDYYIVNTIREIPSWGETDQPAFLVRGFMPTPGQSTADNVTMELFYSLEALLPIDGGSRTLRILSSWNGIMIGDITVENTFSLGCNDVRQAFTDLQLYISRENP